jgi:AcrR family transcriptional regulator
MRPDRTAGAARPRRADAARNARRLLEAARHLFDERGTQVALDEVARRAGVGNATLYRHFPTRRDLLAAVYADEVDALCERGAALLRDAPPAEALFTWLDGFVVHVATKRDLAHGATDGTVGRRAELFGRWHGAMTSTGRRLLTRAQESGDARPDLTVDDMLALASGAALAAADVHHARRLLRTLHHGFTGPAPGERPPPHDDRDTPDR